MNDLSNKKITIFGDCHLTDKFDVKKFEKLKEIVSESEVVIITGDLWDSWFSSFQEFSHKWQEFIDLLDDKYTIHIIGDHDIDVPLLGKHFADQIMEKFTFFSGDKEFIVTHRIPLNLTGFYKIYDRIMQKTENTKIGKIWRNYILHNFEVLAHFLLRKYYLRTPLMKRMNRNMLRQFRKTGAKQWLITGHTHYSELNFTKKYANPGPIHRGHAGYLVIENGELKLHATRL